MSSNTDRLNEGANKMSFNTDYWRGLKSGIECSNRECDWWNHYNGQCTHYNGKCENHKEYITK